MHLDALCTLMDKQEFRNPVSSTLPHGDDPSVHVDFGCGPGTGHPPDTVVAMALAYHAFKAGRQPGDYGVTI